MIVMLKNLDSIKVSTFFESFLKLLHSNIFLHLDVLMLFKFLFGLNVSFFLTNVKTYFDLELFLNSAELSYSNISSKLFLLCFFLLKLLFYSSKEDLT